MNIDSIVNGVTIDHITAGKGMLLYDLLNLEELDCTVAIIKNVSGKSGIKKDVIKIDREIPLNLDVIGYVDPGAKVNIIRDGNVVKKTTMELPERLTNVVFCKNPRCISGTEQELDHIFKLTDRENGVYRCIYCETKC